MELLHRAYEPPAGIVETALELAFGTGREDVLDRSRATPSCPHTPDAALVIHWGASALVARGLRQRGYHIVRRFVVLPSRANPKFLLPFENSCAASDALRAHTAYSRRLRKGITATATALGWPCMRSSTVLVASRRPSCFEVIAQLAAAQKELEVAVYLGAPGIFRKMCVRWMRGSGEAVCHLKLPIIAEANARVLHEATMLNILGRYVHFRWRIPRIIHSGAIDGTQFVVQSALEGEAGPVEFGPCHEDVLRLLHQYQPSRRPGYSIVEAVAERFRRSISGLGNRWRALGSDVLRMASQEIRNSSVDCGLSHGDFTPWNTRLHNGQLSVFDWEAAEMNAPCLWDKFHFLTQARSLLRKGAGIPVEMTCEQHASYLLYLLDSATKLAVEETESNGVAYREAELLKQLQLGSQLDSTPRTIPAGIGAHLDLATRDPSNSMEPIGNEK
jgi:hypothetical protein